MKQSSIISFFKKKNQNITTSSSTNELGLIQNSNADLEESERTVESRSTNSSQPQPQSTTDSAIGTFQEQGQIQSSDRSSVSEEIGVDLRPTTVSKVPDISQDKDDQPVQPRLQMFPGTSSGGQVVRRFQNSWYDKYETLEYSRLNDMVYCFVCRHFSTGRPTSFITGYNDWKNMSTQFQKHFKSENSEHQTNLEKISAYKISKLTGSIACKINSQHSDQVKRNRDVVAAHVQIIILCAQQDLALRGHREQEVFHEEGNMENLGNFAALLKLLKRNNPEFLKKSSEMPKNASYTSKDIQNEIISICGTLVRQSIFKELQHGSKFYAVIGDECKDAGGVEQLSLCLRYVDGLRIRERFIGFIDLHKFDAENISNNIIDYLLSNGVSLNDCVAQSYDGASVMSGDISGVSKRIETAVGGTCSYVHCYAHRLNLVLVSSCTSISTVREVLGLLQAIYNFQSNSVKRSEYFIEAQKSFGLTGNDILRMPQACHTRWISKLKGIKYFKNRLHCVIEALQDIVRDGKPEEAAECKGYIMQLKSYKVVIVLFILDEVLSLTSELSEYLQFPGLVYSRAVNLCDSTLMALRAKRTGNVFNDLLKKADVTMKQIGEEQEPVPARRRKTPSVSIGFFSVHYNWV